MMAFGPPMFKSLMRLMKIEEIYIPLFHKEKRACLIVILYNKMLEFETHICFIYRKEQNEKKIGD